VSLIARGEAIAKYGSEAGFTIKTFSTTLQRIGESWTREEEKEEEEQKKKKRWEKRRICS